MSPVITEAHLAALEQRWRRRQIVDALRSLSFGPLVIGTAVYVLVARNPFILSLVLVGAGLHIAALVLRRRWFR